MIFSSCAPRIIYYGRSYEPTTDVEIYFRESDIKEQHEIMGKLVYEVTAKKRSEKVQRKLMNEAKRKGADVILFDDIELTNMGTNSGGAAAGAGANVSKAEGFVGTYGSRTKYRRGQEVKASLLKFTK